MSLHSKMTHTKQALIVCAIALVLIFACADRTHIKGIQTNEASSSASR